MIDGRRTVASSRLASTACSARALARKKRVGEDGVAPRAPKKTNRRTPACSEARTRRAVATPFSSSIDPYQGYYNYDSSQFEPNGANDAQIVDPAIDAAWATVRGTVDFVAIKHALADFQKVYVEKTVEVPLYYRKQVELFSPKLGNFFANGTQAGMTWNAADWYVKG